MKCERGLLRNGFLTKSFQISSPSKELMLLQRLILDSISYIVEISGNSSQTAQHNDIKNISD